MWFKNLFFSYWVVRLRHGHGIKIKLPETWLWKPVACHVIILDKDYVTQHDEVFKDFGHDNQLKFCAEDGYTVNIILYYTGWFGLFFTTKELNIKIPNRIKPVTDIAVEVLELKNAQLI